MTAGVELILVRHGATSRSGGDGRFVAGQSDSSLTGEGHEQAQCIAARLVGEDLGALFATPLRRTRQTAQPLALATGLPVAILTDLSEVHLGALEPRFASEEYSALMREVLRQQRWDIDPSAEPAASFAARVERGLATVAEAAGSGRIVIFAHGGVIAQACQAATGSLPLAFLPHLRPGSITRLCRGPRRTTLVAYNDTSHLDHAGTPSWRSAHGLSCPT